MWQFDPLVVNPELTVEPPAGETHAIVVGYGRIRKVVCSLLKEHDISYIAVDHDASGVARDRREGHIVYYCDASDLRFLEKCGLRKNNRCYHYSPLSKRDRQGGGWCTRGQT
jgi:K+:H+ antiporter